MKIEFEPVSHTYTVAGEVWPSVTQVLAPLTDFSRVPLETLERARNFGTAVHAMIDLDTKNDLDEDSLDEQLRNVLAQYKLAMATKGGWTYASEQIVGHSKYRYCGTADIIATDRMRRTIVVDIKTGAIPPTVGAQCAAYAAAWCSEDEMANRKVYQRWALSLTETSFKWHKLDDPSDWSLFLSALNCYNFKVKHGTH